MYFRNNKFEASFREVERGELYCPTCSAPLDHEQEIFYCSSCVFACLASSIRNLPSYWLVCKVSSEALEQLKTLVDRLCATSYVHAQRVGQIAASLEATLPVDDKIPRAYQKLQEVVALMEDSQVRDCIPRVATVLEALREIVC
jgi:hypothetical protein